MFDTWILIHLFLFRTCILYLYIMMKVSKLFHCDRETGIEAKLCTRNQESNDKCARESHHVFQHTCKQYFCYYYL